MIKLVTVDDRLLHGQIAFYWTEYLRLDEIIILNDEAATDEFTKMILGLAKPRNVDLRIEEIEKCRDLVIESINNSKSVFLIVGSLFDADRILEFSSTLAHLNIGGLRERPNCKKLIDRISLTKEDINIILKLLAREIYITARPSPQEKEIVISEKVIKLL